MPRMYKDILMDYRRMEEVSTFPKRLYCLSETTVQMILALSESFYWITRWQKPPDESPEDWTTTEQAQIKTWAAQLEDEFSTPIADCDQELNCLDCVDYAPNSARIEWTPQDPYTQPDFTPDGWSVPPWFVVEEGSIPDVTGAEVGDVLSTFDRFAFVDPDSYDREYPHFRVNWNGAAEVELHLLSVPQGGLAIIQLDDGDFNLVELSSYSVADIDSYIAALLEILDLTINGEIYGEVIYELKTETAGAHHADVTLYPTLSIEEFVGWGGGLRKVTICGEVGAEECDSMDVRQNEETPCILEKTEDGETWVEFADLQLCPPKFILVDGVPYWERPDGTLEPIDEWDGEQPIAPRPVPPREGSETDNRCIAAANAVNVLLALHAEVAAKISVPNALMIALTIASLLISMLFIPFATAAILAIISGGGIAIFVSLTYGDFSEEVQEELRCILYCAASDDDGVVTFDFSAAKAGIAENIAPLNIWAALDKYLDIITEGGLNLAGATTAITSADCDECPDCDGVWCFRWDLTETDGGWEPIVFGSADAAYTSGQGWGIGTNSSQEIIITRDFDSVAIDGFRVEFDASILEGTNPYVLWKLNGTTLEDEPVLAPVDYFEVTYDAQIITNLWIGYNSAWTYSAGTDTTARKIVAFQMWGRGENPFGEDNCEVT